MSSRGIIAKNIIRLRKAKGWNQADLALDSGWNVSTIQRIEQAKRDAKVDQLNDIAQSLGVSALDLQSESPILKASSQFSAEDVKRFVEDAAIKASRHAVELLKRPANSHQVVKSKKSVRDMRAALRELPSKIDNDDVIQLFDLTLAFLNQRGRRVSGFE